MKRLKETLAKNAWYFAGVLAEIVWAGNNAQNRWKQHQTPSQDQKTVEILRKVRTGDIL